MDDREAQKRADNGSVILQLILEDMTEEERIKALEKAFQVIYLKKNL